MHELKQDGRVANRFEDGWIPKYLIANGKKGRRNCVVVEQGKKKWKTLDLERFRSGNLARDEDDDDEESMVFD